MIPVIMSSTDVLTSQSWAERAAIELFAYAGGRLWTYSKGLVWQQLSLSGFVQGQVKC